MRKSIPYLLPLLFVALTALGATYVRFQDHTPATTITTTDGVLVHVFSATEVQFTTLAQVFALAENNFGQLVIAGGIDCATLSVSGGIDASSIGSGIDATKIGIGVVDNTEFGALDGVSGTLVGTSSSQTLTNKEMNAEANTFSNFDNNEIKDNAGINPTKLATGIVDATEFEFLNGVTSALLGGDESIAYASDVFTANIAYASDVSAGTIKYASNVDAARIKYASDVFTANIAYASDVYAGQISYASDVYAANVKFVEGKGYVTTSDDSVSGSELDGVFSTTGLLLRTGANTYSTTTNNSTNWDTAYTDRNKWDGSLVSAGNIVNASVVAATIVGKATTENLEITKTAFFDAEYDNGEAGPAKAIDWTLGNKQRLTLGANATISFVTPAGATNLVFRIIQSATGSNTITWPGTVNWPGGTAPTLTTAAGSVDVACLYYNGLNDYYGVASLDMR